MTNSRCASSRYYQRRQVKRRAIAFTTQGNERRFLRVSLLLLLSGEKLRAKNKPARGSPSTLCVYQIRWSRRLRTREGRGAPDEAVKAAEWVRESRRHAKTCCQGARHVFAAVARALARARLARSRPTRAAAAVSLLDGLPNARRDIIALAVRPSRKRRRAGSLLIGRCETRISGRGHGLNG